MITSIRQFFYLAAVVNLSLFGIQDRCQHCSYASDDVLYYVVNGPLLYLKFSVPLLSQYGQIQSFPFESNRPAKMAHAALSRRATQGPCLLCRQPWEHCVQHILYIVQVHMDRYYMVACGVWHQTCSVVVIIFIIYIYQQVFTIFKQC